MTFNATGSTTAWLSVAPRSRHPGGVNVAFSDGHIGFLPDTIDEYTMAYLVSATDGQRVDLSGPLTVERCRWRGERDDSMAGSSQNLRPLMIIPSNHGRDTRLLTHENRAEKGSARSF